MSCRMTRWAKWLDSLCMRGSWPGRMSGRSWNVVVPLHRPASGLREAPFAYRQWQRALLVLTLVFPAEGQ